MATGHNKWILDGRIAYEPELRTTPTGIQVCTLRLCWSKKVGNKETSVFVNAVCWRALAITAARYLHKGDLVGVSGEVSGALKTKQDGRREYVLEINVDDLTFFPQGGKTQTSVGDGYVEAYDPGTEEPPPIDDTLPY